MDAMVVDVLRGIKIPEHALEGIREALKRSVNNSVYDIDTEKRKVLTRLKKEEKKMQRAVNLAISDHISTQELETIRYKIVQKKKELNIQLAALDKIQNNKYNESITLIELANKGFEYYELANVEEKREMLKIVFSDLSFDGKKLDFNLLKPFDMFYECNQSQVWQALRDDSGILTDAHCPKCQLWRLEGYV